VRYRVSTAPTRNHAVFQDIPQHKGHPDIPQNHTAPAPTRLATAATEPIEARKRPRLTAASLSKSLIEQAEEGKTGEHGFGPRKLDFCAPSRGGVNRGIPISSRLPPPTVPYDSKVLGQTGGGASGTHDRDGVSKMWRCDGERVRSRSTRNLLESKHPSVQLGHAVSRTGNDGRALSPIPRPASREILDPTSLAM